VRDQQGEIYTVRYDAVNAMLLNEFLKEHRKVQQQQAAISQQRRDFEATIIDLRQQLQALAARVEQHDSDIQNVSVQVQMSRGTKLVADGQ
jgi:chromosome segregation ATPase